MHYSSQRMSVTTSQQISKYYDLYKQVEVAFNSQVISVLGLLPKQVYLKCLGDYFPCIIYSTSMKEARVIASLQARAFKTLRHANNSVALRFSFKKPDKTDPLSFFVKGKVTGYTPYNKKKPDFHLVSLTYTQKPPDDLIEMLGELLEASANAKRRKEFRVVISPQSQRSLGLDSKDTTIEIEAVPRRCIIRDLSFSGARILLAGMAKFMMNKEAILRLSFDNQEDQIRLPGKVIRYEEVQGRREIAAIALSFEEDKVPMAYNLRINDYLRTQRHKPSAGSSEPVPD